MKKEKIIFLDRDGTINVEVDYLHRVEDFQFIDGVPEAIKIFKDLGYKVVVVSNQSGIARGYYDTKSVDVLHKYIDTQLGNYKIDKYYYCPHHPNGINEYKKICDCRKPKLGMFHKVQKDFEIDNKNSYMVGDKISDAEFGVNAGLIPILVRSGHKFNLEEQHKNIKIFDNLLDFAKFLTVGTTGIA